MYSRSDLALKIIMHCKAPKAIEFRSRLGFNQYDMDLITLTKEQSILKSVMDAFEGENMQTQYSVLGYRIDLYFHDYRLDLYFHDYRLMKKVIKTEILTMKYKDKKH